VFLIENNHTPVGVVGIDWRQPDAPELGYWLGVEHWAWVSAPKRRGR